MKICDYLSSLPSLHAAANRVLDFLIPESCVGCRTGGVALCEACIRSIPSPAYGKSKDIISLFDYRNKIIRKALWALKYKGGRRIGGILGGRMHVKVIEVMRSDSVARDFKQAVLIPIPLSKKRLRERGFNQSEILAKELSYRDRERSFTVDTSVLYRVRDTGSQALIRDREMRMNNVRECFAVNNKNKIIGKNIILIDDITTTGATLEEARETLLRAGAKQVIGITVAH